MPRAKRHLLTMMRSEHHTKLRCHLNESLRTAATMRRWATAMPTLRIKLGQAIALRNTHLLNTIALLHIRILLALSVPMADGHLTKGTATNTHRTHSLNTLSRPEDSSEAEATLELITHTTRRSTRITTRLGLHRVLSWFSLEIPASVGSSVTNVAAWGGERARGSEETRCVNGAMVSGACCSLCLA